MLYKPINNQVFFRFDKEIVRSKQWANLPLASKSIFPVIAVHCNEKGLAFPGQERIAEYTGCTPKTVRKGIEGLKHLPGFTVSKEVSRTGHFQNKYVIKAAPNHRGRWFPLFKSAICVNEWKNLNASAQALYITMRAFSFFDGETYADFEDNDYGYDVRFMIEEGEFAKRKYDFVDADPEVLAEYSGISMDTLPKALNSLINNGFAEEIEPIRYYDTCTWMIYIVPAELFQEKLPIK